MQSVNTNNITYIRSPDPSHGTRSTLLPPPAIIVAEDPRSRSQSPPVMMTVDTARNAAAQQQRRSPSPPASDFDLSLLPQDRIFKRTLMPWSVHYSVTTGKWIATISRRDGAISQKSRLIQLFFRSEKEARKFCKTYSPPKFDNANNASTTAACCRLCQSRTELQRHCRNCGVLVCDRCSTRWGSRMVPKTYMSNSSALTLRVCKSCNWLSNAFCMSLLQGRYQDALTLHETGNVNLRTCFADIHREAMFPIHCAVMGGSLQLVQWLVDTHLVPISVAFDRKKGHMLSVQTSANRTLLDLAMTGRHGPKVDILCYLVSKGLSATDVKDQALIPKTLEAILRAGGCSPMISNTTQNNQTTPNAIIIPPDQNNNPHADAAVPEADETTCLEDACCLCYERQMDCVLIPCGHQMCCAECAGQLTACPLCKASCSVLRVFRQ